MVGCYRNKKTHSELQPDICQFKFSLIIEDGFFSYWMAVLPFHHVKTQNKYVNDTLSFFTSTGTSKKSLCGPFFCWFMF